MIDESKLRYRDLIYILISEIDQIQTLFLGVKKYCALIEALERFNSEMEDLPKQVSILEALGLKRGELMTLMNGLYKEYISLIEQSYPISKTEIHLNIFTYGEGYHFVKFNDLKHIPKIGETLSFSFLRSFYGGINVTVTDVDHEFENGKHIIHIHAKDQFVLRGEV